MNIEPLSGRDLVEAQQMVNNVSHKAEFRARGIQIGRDIRGGDLIQELDLSKAALNVQAVIDVGNMGMEYRALCTQRMPTS